MGKIFYMVMGFIFFLIPLFTVQGAEVTDMRWVTRNDAAVPFVRIVLDLDKPVRASADIDSSGTSTVVTLHNTKMKDAPKRVSMDASIVTAATAVETKGDLKITIQTPKAIDVENVKVFPLKMDKAHNKPPRLVIDIQKKIDKPIRKTARFKYTPGLKDKVIVVDPGHGGSDPGAIGPHKVMEKTITLEIAKLLKHELEAKGATVYLTRTTDRDVYKALADGVDELQARVDVAEKYDADVFLSLHIDSFSNPAVGGITSYYHGKTPYDRTLAASILPHIENMKGFVGSRGVKPANFYIMKHSSMPASLLELGFISNPKEEQLLTEEKTQQAFAKGIAEGIYDYFQKAKG